MNHMNRHMNRHSRPRQAKEKTMPSERIEFTGSRATEEGDPRNPGIVREASAQCSLWIVA